MKKIISNIAALFLVVLVLFSSVSFTVEKHLCGGQVFSESVFGKAKDCGMDEKCCKEENNNLYFSKKSCCSDEIQLINGSVFEKVTVLKLANNQQNLFAFTLLNYSIFSPINKSRIIQINNYFPPPNTHNFNILYEIFRI
ncbi:MAG: hypothetical protein GZ086_12745 [Gelidibacter sp.]|nr:hypothetical protein [Gelidibacter sp.]